MTRTRKRQSTDYIVVHGSYSYPHMDIGFKEIDLWHRKRGFMRIGYHSIIRRDGTVEQGRDPDTIGAAVYGYNDVSYHICLAGGQSENKEWENNYTQKQLDALRQLIDDLLIIYPNATVNSHSDFPEVTKNCPAFNVSRWYHND